MAITREAGTIVRNKSSYYDNPSTGAAGSTGGSSGKDPKKKTTPANANTVLATSGYGQNNLRPNYSFPQNPWLGGLNAFTSADYSTAFGSKKFNNPSYYPSYTMPGYGNPKAYPTYTMPGQAQTNYSNVGLHNRVMTHVVQNRVQSGKPSGATGVGSGGIGGGGGGGGGGYGGGSGGSGSSSGNNWNVIGTVMSWRIATG